MKQFFIIMVALLIVHGSHAQWIQQNSGTQASLHSVFFTDSITGYAVGSAGTILKTTNGGENWSLQNSGTSTTLRSVFFPVADTGYAVGYEGTILKTSNAGEEWINPVSGISGGDSNFYSVFFTNAITGYIVGGGSDPMSTCGILKTTDGGATWNSQGWGGFNSHFHSIFFTSPDTGYAVYTYFIFQKGSWGSAIIKTTNSGSSWHEIYDLPFTFELLQSICFAEKETGFAVGDGGTILKSGNADTVWNRQTTGTTNALFSVTAIPSGSGSEVAYAVGSKGTILKKMPWDTIWETQASGTLNTLNSVMFTDINKGYAVGDSGVIMKTNNGGGIGISEIQNPNGQVMIYPNPSSDQVTIELSNFLNDALLIILDLNGQELVNKKLKQNKTQVDVSILPMGVYVLKVIGEKTVAVGKILKE